MAVTRIEVKRKWIVPTRWLRRRINAKSFFPPRMLRMAYRIDAYALPKADLVVSTGGETHMPNICVSRFLDIPSIICGSLMRGLGPENFTLTISSYDRDAGSARHRGRTEAVFDRSRQRSAGPHRAALRT